MDTKICSTNVGMYEFEELISKTTQLPSFQIDKE